MKANNSLSNCGRAMNKLTPLKGISDLLKTVFIFSIILIGSYQGKSQCTTCTYTVTGTSSTNYNLNSAAEVVCIETGAVWTGGVNANNGGTICIKKGGTATLGSINGKPNVQNSGTVTLNFNMNTGQVISNNKDGKMTITGINFNGAGTINNFEGSRGLTITSASFQLGNGSKIYNEDTIKVTGGLSTSSGTEVLNKGWIYVSGNHFNPNGLVNNYGIISTSEFLNINSNAVVNNYCWFIGDAFNFNGTSAFKNYGGIWVSDASQGWRVNSGSVELGKESIVYSLGDFLNNGLIKMMTVDSLATGAQFYVEGFSKNQGIFGRSGNKINFFDKGATTFDAPGGTISASTTYGFIPKPDTSVFASTCEARVAGKPAPIIDLDDNNSTAPGVDYLGVFTEKGGAVKINDIDIKITESSGKLDSAIIILTNPLDGVAIEKLFAGTMPAGIVATVSPNGSQIKLSGQATLVAYQNAISAITYNNTSLNPNLTSRIITVTIYNPTKRQGSAQATLTITRVNDNPVANPDVNAITEGTPSVSSITSNQVLVNDTDVDGDILTVSAIKGTGATATAVTTTATVSGKYGSLLINANGNYTYTLSNAAVDSLRQGEQVLDVFTYTASDGKGGTASTTLTITITGVNDAPVALDDVNSISEGTASITSTSANQVLKNDTDVDRNPLTVSSIRGASPTATTVTTTATVNGKYGSLLINANGTYTYTLNNASVDSLRQGEQVLDVFTYTANDGLVNSVAAKLTITITGVNDAPIAVNDVNSITEGTSSISSTAANQVLKNDSDVDRNTLTVSTIKGTGAASPVTTTATVNGKYGSLLINANGSYTYTLNNNAVDSLRQGEQVLDVFTYTANDGIINSAAATLTITITGVNDAPIAVDDVNSISEGTASVTSTSANNILKNDTDVDRNALTVTSIKGDNSGTVAGIYGVLTWSSNGSYTYTLNNNAVDSLYQGEIVKDVFPYIASDGIATATANLTITITGTNDNPIAVNDANSMSEETPSVTHLDGTGTLLKNDSDIDGDVITVSTVNNSSVKTTAGTYGSLTWAVDGTYTYTLNTSLPIVSSLGDGEKLTETFTYRITDGKGGTANASLIITITGGNSNPVANPDVNEITEDQVSVSHTNGSGTLKQNDTDTDASDVLTITKINGNTSKTTLGTYGTLTWNADGTYTYTLNNSLPAIQALAVGASVNEVFTYVIEDGKGGSASSTLTIKINGANDLPKANPDINSITEGVVSVTETNGNGRLTLNDTDVDVGDVLTVTKVNDATSKTTVGKYGTLVWIANGSYTYTQNQNATDTLTEGEKVTDVFTYTVSDGKGGTAISTLTITITGVNDVPVAVNDTKEIKEGALSVTDASAGGTGALIVNDTDADFDNLVIQSIKGNTTGTIIGKYGTLTWLPNGTYTYTLNNASVDSLKEGQKVLDVFPYVVTDGLATATANLTITVVGVNDAPIVVDDSKGITEGTASVTNSSPGGTGALLDNDSDVDGDVLIVKSIKGNTSGTVEGIYGTLTWNSDGTYSYVLHNDRVDTLSLGEQVLDVFPYTATDGIASVNGKLTITITGANDAPKAVNDANNMSENVDFVTHVDGSGTLLSNDSDIDKDQLSVSLINGSTDKTTLGTYGTLTWDSDGTYSYDLDNLLPIVAGLGEGEILKDTFKYQLSDGKGSFDEALLIITITGGNSAPTANPDVNSIFEDSVSISHTNGSGTLISNDLDLDASDKLVVTTINGVTDKVVIGLYGTLTWDTDGTYTYVLDNTNPKVQELAVGETLNEIFTYSITDNNGGNSSSTLTITVKGTNDKPVANPDENEIFEDQVSVTSNSTNLLTINDTDTDKTDKLTLVSINGKQSPTEGLYGTITWDEYGNYTYVLNNTSSVVQALAVGESVKDTFTYIVKDGNGLSDTSILVLTIKGVNDKPIALDDSISINEDQTEVVSTTSLLLNDKDPDKSDTLVVKSINGSTNPEVVGTYGTVKWNVDGTYSYVLDNTLNSVQALGLGESIKDTFNYVISDGKGGLDTAKLIVTINGVNDAPVALDDTISIKEDVLEVVGTVSLLVNDKDVDKNDTLVVLSINDQVTSEVKGTYGTIKWNVDGTYTYVLDNTKTEVQELAVGETKKDTFIYVVSDGKGGLDTAKLVVTIVGVNDLPNALDDINDITVGSVSVSKIDRATGVLENDSDVDKTDVLNVTTFSTVATSVGSVKGLYGTLTWKADGSYVYTLDNKNTSVLTLSSGQNLKDVFPYQLTDGNGGNANAKLTITINGSNVSPVANPDVNSILEDQISVTSTVDNHLLKNDTDANASDVLTVTKINNVITKTVTGKYGTLNWLADGNYTYVLNNSLTKVQALNQGDTLQDIFGYEISDGKNGSATSTLTITVLGVNDSPVFPGDSIIRKTINENTSTTIEVKATDVDDKVLTYTVTKNPKNGTATVDPLTGIVTYTPVKDFYGNDTILISGCDPGSLCDQIAIVMTVLDVNKAPVANDDNAKVPYQGSVDIKVLTNDTDPDGDEEKDPSSVVITRQPANGTVSVDPITGVVTYKPNPGFQGQDSFEYKFSDFKGAVSNEATVLIDVNHRPPFKVFEAVTPNGDSKNDYLHIENIEYYPNTNVQIFNRWGNVVWELPKTCNGYQNGDQECSFVGKSNVGLGSGGPVADGSYYYVVDGSADGVKPCQGYAVVKN